jgi:hypothetical protein
MKKRKNREMDSAISKNLKIHTWSIVTKWVFFPDSREISEIGLKTAFLRNPKLAIWRSKGSIPRLAFFQIEKKQLFQLAKKRVFFSKMKVVYFFLKKVKKTCFFSDFFYQDVVACSRSGGLLKKSETPHFRCF